MTTKLYLKHQQQESRLEHKWSHPQDVAGKLSERTVFEGIYVWMLWYLVLWYNTRVPYWEQLLRLRHWYFKTGLRRRWKILLRLHETRRIIIEWYLSWEGDLRMSTLIAPTRISWSSPITILNQKSSTLFFWNITFKMVTARYDVSITDFFDISAVYFDDVNLSLLSFATRRIHS